MLPGENNWFVPDGIIDALGVDASGHATLTDLNATYFDPATGTRAAGIDPRINGNTYEFRILSGAARGAVLKTLSVAGSTVTFEAGWPNGITPSIGDKYFFRPVNPNDLVAEADQVDVLNVFDKNSISNDVGVLTDHRLSGLGMGPDTVIAGRVFKGGISYTNLESFNLELGSGNDTLTIDSTIAGSTSVKTGAGNDIINVKMIAGHTSIETGAGTDTVNAGNDKQLIDQIAALLTVVGGNTSVDTLNINDRGDNNNNTGALTGSNLRGLDMPSVREAQTVFVRAAKGDFSLTAAGQGTINLTYGMDAAQMQTAIQGLYGDSNNDISVVKEGDLYTIFFGGSFAGRNLAQMTLGDVSLKPHLNASVKLVAATLEQGTVTPALNTVQTLRLNATGGTFALTLLGTTTTPVAFDASADVLLNALDPILNPNNANPNRPHTSNVAVSKYGNVFQITFQGKHRNLGLAAADVDGALLTGGAILLSDGSLQDGGAISLQTRTDGINYYAIDTLNIDLGSGADTFNVHGTSNSTVTNLNTHDGNDTIQVSSHAPANIGDIHASSYAPDNKGILDQVKGLLNIDAGKHANLLNISDQGSLQADTAAVISKNRITGLAPADISYTATGGSFNRDVNIWAGQGNDHITVASVRADSITSLLTAAGDDTVIVQASHTAGQLVIEGQAGNDTIDGSASSTGMILIGNLGNDRITGGQGSDTIFGDDAHVVHDHARVIISSIESRAGFVAGSDTIFGGAGNDILIGDFARVIRNPDQSTALIESVFPSQGGNDIISGDAGDDVILGGFGQDRLFGMSGSDFLIGDNGRVRFQGAHTLVQTLNLFIGQNDFLSGGSGHDYMFGGFGNRDTFVGNFSEDIIMGDNGRVTLLLGRPQLVASLSLGRLDIIAQTLDELYNHDLSKMVDLRPQMEDRDIVQRLQSSLQRYAALVATYYQPSLEQQRYFDQVVSRFEFLIHVYSGHGDSSHDLIQHEWIETPQGLQVVPDGLAPENIENNPGGLPVNTPVQQGALLDDGSDLLQGEAKNDELLDASLVALAGWQMMQGSSKTGNEHLKRQNARRIRW